MTDLIGQYRQMHDAGKFAGFSVLEHKEQIGELIRELECASVLDYGCGKGYQYSRHAIHAEWGGVSLRLYDPAVAGYTTDPEVADGVICCDVMEHIPETDVPKTLRRVISLARKFVFFVICTRASKKTLPDGRNCHLTIQPREWWLDAIKREIERLGTTVRIVVEFRDGL